jgi:hypothetical protein
MTARIFVFDESRRVTIDHVTSFHTYGYHACNFTVCDHGHCTMYVLEVRSDLIGTLKPRELAKHLVDNVESAAVVKTFKEG